MTTFEMIGFFVVVLSSAIGLSVILIAAGYGAVIVYWQWQEGLDWEKTAQQIRREKLENLWPK